MKGQLQLNLGEIEWSGRETINSRERGPAAPWMMPDLAASSEGQFGRDAENPEIVSDLESLPQA